MAGDLTRFVDSIVASPTVRLDLNDETSWWVKRFDAPPPRLRRSVATNAMRDGISPGVATYDARTLTIELECRKSSQDLAAAELQKLARELDRTNNWLMYQPNGLTKPVFFRTYRSDASQIADVVAQQAMRTFTIELLAEPFALGLRENLSAATITNDPAAGSNGCYMDISGILGDVATPAVIGTGTHTVGWGVLAMRSRGTPSDLAWFVQCETTAAVTLGTDTANPGGGPDAAMSGTGTNNFVRTTFANASLNTRLTWDVSVTSATRAQRLALVGTYRVYAGVRRSDATSVMTVQQLGEDPVTVPATTVRQLVDVGTYSLESPAASGYEYSNPIRPKVITLQAQRLSGTGNLDWDFIALVPADTSVLTWSVATEPSLEAFMIDGYSESVSNYSIFGPFDAANGEVRSDAIAAGGFPMLVPNQAARLYHLEEKPTGEHDKTRTNALYVSYWPRYLYVRPVSS